MADETVFTREGFSGVTSPPTTEDLIEILAEEQHILFTELTSLKRWKEKLDREYTEVCGKWTAVSDRIAKIRQGQLELDV